MITGKAKLLHFHAVYILNTVLTIMFSLVTCLFHNLCVRVARRAAALCQSLPRSKYYFIPSCLARSQVCWASSDQDEERTWHTPYKASPVRSWLNSGIIRIAGLWRDSPFPFYCNWKSWILWWSVFHFTSRHTSLRWCSHCVCETL